MAIKQIKLDFDSTIILTKDFQQLSKEASDVFGGSVVCAFL
jgi:hypothetical protein